MFCPVVRLVSRFKWSFITTMGHSRNFENFTIRSPGSPFLMVPVQELALEEKKKKMSDVPRMNWNLMDRPEENKAPLWKRLQLDTEYKSHTGCSPLQPPSYSWTQAERSWQMSTEQMKVIDVKFPFKLLFEKLVPLFYWLSVSPSWRQWAHSL